MILLSGRRGKSWRKCAEQGGWSATKPLKFFWSLPAHNQLFRGYWKQFHCGVEQWYSIGCSITSIGHITFFIHYDISSNSDGSFIYQGVEREATRPLFWCVSCPSRSRNDKGYSLNGLWSHFTLAWFIPKLSKLHDVLASRSPSHNLQVGSSIVKIFWNQIAPITTALTLQFHCWITGSVNWILSLMNLHHSVSSCAYYHS